MQNGYQDEMKAALILALLASPFPTEAVEDAPPQPPAALQGCLYLREETFRWYVQFDHESEGKLFAILLAKHYDGKSAFTKDRRLISIGESFPKYGPATDRFKFIGFVEKVVMSKRTKLSMKVQFARFEDLKPNKKGRIYESQYGLPDSDIDAHAQDDRTAVFAFKPGDDGKVIEFKAEELTHFALPPEATSKDYFLKEVGPDQVLVEYRDKSGTPRIARIGKKPDTHHTNLIAPVTEDAKAILGRLEKLETTPYGVENMELGKAVDRLNRGTDGKSTPVINVVVRRAKGDLKKVSLDRNASPFAAAIDSLCRQADCRWTVEVEPETKHPVLVISSRKK
jgi:hypothetical protein